MVNCLPLYDPPPMVEKEAESDSPPDVKISINEDSISLGKASTEDSKQMRTFSLIKYRSENALDSVTAELELHDSDFIIHKSEECIGKVPVRVSSKNKFSHSYSKNLTVLVHTNSSSNSSLGMSQTNYHDYLGTGGSLRRRSASEGVDPEVIMTVGSQVVYPGNGQEVSTPAHSAPAESPQSTLERADPEPATSKTNRTKRHNSKSASLDDNGGSDDDSNRQHLQVNYLDPPDVPSRGTSGSVSFYSKTPGTDHSKVEKGRNGKLAGGTSSSNPKEQTFSATSQDTKSPRNSLKLLPQATAEEMMKCSLVPSPLPVPPSTLDPSYIERSGWLNKLSHRRGMFGDKWQKRYFVLHRSWLYYFKKYGVSFMKIEFVM